jgi:hypothetical protein
VTFNIPTAEWPGDIYVPWDIRFEQLC